jgi:membrane fusion protein, multidrug efflux system
MSTDAVAHRGAPAPAPRGRHRGLVIAAVIAAGLAAVVVVTGILSRSHQTAQTKSWTDAQAIPAVTTIAPTLETGAQDLVLPGNLAAYYNAQIYARVSGYVHGWYQDIGARVHTGQLLATIDTPELDQQLQQARADLASAKANATLADATSRRWNHLLTQDAVSRQETEEKAADFQVKTAQVNASEANLDRLLALKSFARIVAPFDGVVTARRTDIGALVNAGASASPNSELFDVAKVDRLRLYVHVPQSYSARIRPGVQASLTVPEYPGKSFPAQVFSNANAVSDSSGTLLVELSVANPGGVLKTGDYAQVTFKLPNGDTGGMLRLPSSALLFRKNGLQAAVVGSDDRVHLKAVTAARDLGSATEIAHGLSPSDKVIDNPPDSIAEGELVRVVPADHSAARSETSHAAG